MEAKKKTHFHRKASQRTQAHYPPFLSAYPGGLCPTKIMMRHFLRQVDVAILNEYEIDWSSTNSCSQALSLVAKKGVADSTQPSTKWCKAYSIGYTNAHSIFPVKEKRVLMSHHMTVLYHVAAGEFKPPNICDAFIGSGSPSSHPRHKH